MVIISGEEDEDETLSLSQIARMEEAENALKTENSSPLNDQQTITTPDISNISHVESNVDYCEPIGKWSMSPTTTAQSLLMPESDMVSIYLFVSVIFILADKNKCVSYF